MYSERRKGGDMMITRKHLLIAILTTCLLTMFLITVIPISSQTAGQYDPWLDTNDDGKIDIRDIALTAKAFGTSGDPINKTALLLELQSEIDSLNSSLLNLEANLETRITNQDTLIAELQSTIDSLNASLVDTQSTVNSLHDTVNQLQSRVNSLEEQANSVKTIRFYTPNETTLTFPLETDVAVFTWTPQNATNNAIMQVACYFQYLQNDPLRHYTTFQILINGLALVRAGTYPMSIDEQTGDNYRQSILFGHSEISAEPNHGTYTIRVQAMAATYNQVSYVKEIGRAHV